MKKFKLNKTQKRVIDVFQELCDTNLIYTTNKGFKNYPEYTIGYSTFYIKGCPYELIWDNDGCFVRNPFPEDDYTEILFESPQLQFKTAIKYLLKLKHCRDPKVLY